MAGVFFNAGRDRDRDDGRQEGIHAGYKKIEQKYSGFLGVASSQQLFFSQKNYKYTPLL